jgi:hypothetical protein
MDSQSALLHTHTHTHIYKHHICMSTNIHTHTHTHTHTYRAVLYEDGWHPVDLMVDGNPYGQSALRFLAERTDQPADRSWLELSQEVPDDRDKVMVEWLYAYIVIHIHVCIYINGQSALRFLAERTDQPADRSWLELSQEVPDDRDKLMVICIYCDTYTCMHIHELSQEVPHDRDKVMIVHTCMHIL